MYDGMRTSVFVSEIVRLLMSMQVDRINQQRIFWSGKYVNPNSKEYKTLEGESNYAVSGRKYFIFCIFAHEKLLQLLAQRNIMQIELYSTEANRIIQHRSKSI